MQVVSHHRIECGKGLIHEEDVGLDRERPSDPDTLPLAARQFAGIPLGQGLQLDHAQVLLSDLADLVAIEPPHPRREGDVAFHGQPRQ
jgi:hypothetical protein